MGFETLKSNKSELSVMTETKSESQIEIIYDREGEPGDLFIREGDKKINLREFMPKKVLLRFADRFAYDSVNNIIFLEQLEITTPKGRLALLHEIGHSIDFQNNEVQQKQLAVQDIAKRINKVQVKLIISEPSEYLEDQKKHEAYLTENLPKIIKELNIPVKSIEFFIKNMARNERTAWAEALKLHRKIKRDAGINILGDLENKEVIDFMKDALGKYEKVFGQLLPEQEIKLFLAKKFSNA